MCSELLSLPNRLTVLLDFLERALAGVSLVRLPPALLERELVDRVASEELYVSASACDPSATESAARPLTPARADLLCELLKLLFNVTLDRARSSRSAPKAKPTGTPVHRVRAHSATRTRLLPSLLSVSVLFQSISALDSSTFLLLEYRTC